MDESMANNVNNPFVSVIVPCFNAENTIVRCIRSLVHQTYGNMEIICIDDGSEDQTREILRGLSKEWHVTVVTNEKKIGPNKTRMRGFEESQGEYILFVDADDEVSSDYVIGLMGSAKGVNDGIVVSSCVQEKHGILVELEPVKLICNAPVECMLESKGLDIQWCVVWGKMIPAKFVERVFQQVNTDLQINEDLLFNSVLIPMVKSISICKDAKYIYHERGESLTHRNMDAVEVSKCLSDMKSVFKSIKKMCNPHDKRQQRLFREWKRRYYSIWVHKIAASNLKKVNKIYLMLKCVKTFYRNI